MTQRRRGHVTQPPGVSFEVGRAEFDALSEDGVTGIPAKPFFVCRHDMADDRVYRLSMGTTWFPVDKLGVDGVGDWPVKKVGVGDWKPDVSSITFFRSTHTVSREYLGMEFMDWAPGWCFLRLGRRPA